MALKLLLVEDDDTVALEVVKEMTGRGHRVHRAETAEAASLMTIAETYDVIIVDRMLPGTDGLELIRSLRAREDTTPALVLTALGGISDRVTGLRSGADDYVVKPFSMDELEARAEVLARRNTARALRVSIGDLVLDRLDRTVHRGTSRISLMPREFQLLEILMLNSPAVVTRAILLEEVWGIRFDPGTNLVESHVSRLRAKINRGGDPPLIHTVRGEGYVALAG